MIRTITASLAVLAMTAGGAFAQEEVETARQTAETEGCAEARLTGQGDSSGGGRYYTFECAGGTVAWVDCANGRCQARLL